MSFIQPLPCSEETDSSDFLTGYCLTDGTPIAISLINGVQTSWTNLITGVSTAGTPPAGFGPCAEEFEIVHPPGTLGEGNEFSISNVAVEVLPENPDRKKYIVQNTGTANIRVGDSSVTATTGTRLVPNGSILMEMPNCPTQAIFAIREGASDSIAFSQEIT